MTDTQSEQPFHRDGIEIERKLMSELSGYLRSAEARGMLGVLKDDGLYAENVVATADGSGWCKYIRNPARAGHDRPLHTHEFDQVYLVLRGTINVELGDAQIEVGPGDLVVIPKGLAHRQWNSSDEVTEHFEFMAADLVV